MLPRRMTAAVPSLPLPPLQGYLFALIVVLVAWLLSFVSNVFIGPPISVLPLVMAIVLAAGAGGLNSGLLSTVVGPAGVGGQGGRVAGGDDCTALHASAILHAGCIHGSDVRRQSTRDVP